MIKSSINNFKDRPPNRGITLSFSYPIMDWGRGSARVQQHEATLRDRELFLENQKLDIIREVRDLVRSVRESLNRLKIQEKNQATAQRSYRISQMRYENGDITGQELGIEQGRL
ncbi:TolC family protein, partial [candidate division KSB1 bacterium]